MFIYYGKLTSQSKKNENKKEKHIALDYFRTFI